MSALTGVSRTPSLWSFWLKMRINDDDGGGDDDDGVDGDDDDVDDDGNAFNLLAVSEMAAVGANRASQT